MLGREPDPILAPVPDASTPTPLGAALVLSFVASVGTYVVESGIYFLTSGTYRFGEVENYTLGVGLGLTYIAGAVGAGPMLRRLRELHPALTSRLVLMGMMLAMAVLCAVPLAASRLLPAGSDAAPPKWPMWVLVLVYSPLTGVMWPMIESYVSGGKAEGALRSAMGRWNVVWSSALVVGALGIAPFVEARAAEVVLSLAVLHAACVPLLRRFGAEPEPHPAEGPHAAPPVYRRLLVTFRWLLPASYVVSSAMMPFLPGLTRALGVSSATQVLISSVWLVSRTGAFYALQRTHAWHGRWWLPTLGMGCMLGGFALVALCRVVGADRGVALAMLVGGLALFGVGMASIYVGAIYYAMEVGQAEVDAGGTHEGLIGVGFALGPGIGLAAASAVREGRLDRAMLEPAVLGGVALISVAAAGVASWRILSLKDAR